MYFRQSAKRGNIASNGSEPSGSVAEWELGGFCVRKLLSSSRVLGCNIAPIAGSVPGGKLVVTGSRLRCKQFLSQSQTMADMLRLSTWNHFKKQLGCYAS